MEVKVIGAGLAGCEAAWQLAKRGISVGLYEMKPQKMSPAHHSQDFAELVCSNSPEELKQSGYVIVSPNYRLMPDVEISDCIDDAV